MDANKKYWPPMYSIIVAVITLFVVLVFATALFLALIEGNLNSGRSNNAAARQHQQQGDIAGAGGAAAGSFKEELDELKVAVESLSEQIDVGLASIGTTLFHLKSAVNNKTVFVPVGHDRFLTTVGWDYGSNATIVDVVLECGTTAVHQDSLVDCWIRLLDRAFFAKVFDSGAGYLAIDEGPQFLAETQRFHAIKKGSDEGGDFWALTLQDDAKKVLSVVQAGYLVSNVTKKQCSRCDHFYLDEVE